MKQTINISKYFQFFFLLITSFAFFSCQRDQDIEDDDIPQEEITNVILNVKDLESGNVISYNYIIGAESPTIKLEDGKTYEVDAIFKNGYEDVTEEIIEAKDEHFLIFDFPRSNVDLTRMDGEESTGALGKVGLKTRWKINQLEVHASPLVKLYLIHDAISASEAQSGTAWGSTYGGETDVEATFLLSH